MTHAHTHQWVDGKHSGGPLPGSRQTETIRENTKARDTEPSRGMQMSPDNSGGTQKSRAERTAPPMGTARGPRADPAKPASHAPRLRRAATKRTPNLAAGDSRAAGREPHAAARRRRSAFATGPQRFRGSSEGARQPAPQSP